MNNKSNRKRLPVGISDFKDVVTGDYYYIDKSLFIKEILDKGDKIILVPRPRRFGKTLNLSMLKYFFDCCPDTFTIAAESPSNPNETAGQPNTNENLFASLAISREDKEYLDKMGKYPVIYLTFKDIKETDWQTAYRKLIKLIRQEYSKHDYLLDSERLKPMDKDYFKMVLKLKGERDDYESSLGMLLMFLNRYYGKRVVILVDEYDAPIHAGFANGYYKEIINFMRNFLSGGLKDMDQYLEKSILTGILRIAKESIFSGLNNPGVYTLLAEEFNDKFGFTENEVECLLRDFDLLHKYDEVQLWYNGYRFGSRVIYNPWSILNYLNSEDKKFKPHWINTSDNELVDNLLSKGGKELKEEIERLLQGETIEKAIDENIVLTDIVTNEELLWSFLLMGGYLKQTANRINSFSFKTYYTLSIPNNEVKFTYFNIINRYFVTKVANKKLEIMLKALIDGDVPLFEKMLRIVVTAVFSYHDFAGEPEKVYHALVAGLLIWLTETHEIKSNRESGYGRYDIMIIPINPAGMGYVMEFKAVDTDAGETVTTASNAALKQIEDKKYDTELIARGITNIKKLAVVFNGKEVHVKEKSPQNTEVTVHE